MSSRTRRSFLLGGLALATHGPAGPLASATATVVADPSLATTPLVPSRRASILIGYGVVNHWHGVDAAQLAILLAHNGLTLTEIEYVAWFDADGESGRSLRTDVDAAERFVNVMRTSEVTTLISLVNWNSQAPRQAPRAWFLDRLREIRDRIGPARVLLLPVSEPDGSAKSIEWQELALQEWPGPTVLNGRGGRGEPLVVGGQYVDWHWCQDFTPETVRVVTAGRSTINNTDCTPVLNPGPVRVARMARAALDRGAHFLVYDGRGSVIDEAVILALGAEVWRPGLAPP